MGKNYHSTFDKIGLNSLYIIDDSGLPLLIRNYFAEDYSDEKNIIITSFASAISIFAQNILVSFISDIGIQEKRLFFKYQSGFIYLLVFDEKKLLDLTLYKIHELIAIIVWRLDSIFKDYYYNNLKPDNKESLPIDIQNEEKEVDKLVAKGCRDWYEIQEKTVQNTNEADKKVGRFSRTSKKVFLKDIGLTAFYFLDNNNEALYKHLFTSSNPLIEDEETLAAFLTAIRSFSKAYLFSNVSDVGMFNQRLFLNRGKHSTIVVVIDDLKFLAQSRKEEEVVINIFFEEIESELSSMLRRPRRKKRRVGSKTRKRRPPVQLRDSHIEDLKKFAKIIVNNSWKRYKEFKG